VAPVDAIGHRPGPPRRHASFCRLLRALVVAFSQLDLELIRKGKRQLERSQQA
jgi:hypothetical protein